MASQLSIIFNELLSSRTLPKTWKLANMVTIFKKGCKSKPENYKPVSLTSIGCKVMETLIEERMLEYLKKNDLFSDKQHGFTRGRSCLTNQLETFNEKQALDNGYGINNFWRSNWNN